MKNTIISLMFIFTLSIYGCSSDDTTGANNTNQQEAQEQVSQAETMEEIWASSLDPAEKARRVQELLARSGN
jgi:hypothetical protein